MKIELKIDSKENTKFFNRIGNFEPLMKELSLMGVSAVQKNIEQGIKPDNAPLTKDVKQGSNTLRDTGRLRASITADHDATTAIVGTNVKYARLQNEGGVIRPKKAKALCIPASPKTRTFQRRYGFSAKAVLDGLRGDGWSVYQPLNKSGRRGNVIMAQKGKNKKPIAVFILRKSVTIPARPFMFLPESEIKKMQNRVDTYITRN